MVRASDGTDVPVFSVTCLLFEYGFSSLLDLEGTGHRASTKEEKTNEMFVQVAKSLLLIQSVSSFENLRPNAVPDSGFV